MCCAIARNPLPIWLHGWYRESFKLCVLRLSTQIDENEVVAHLGYDAAYCEYCRKDMKFRDILSIPSSGLIK